MNCTKENLKSSFYLEKHLDRKDRGNVNSAMVKYIKKLKCTKCFNFNNKYQ